MQELATGYGLIEGPVWDPAKGLYFSDVVGGGIYLLDRAGEISFAVPKRRGVGGMALHADGGLIAGGRDIVHVSLADHSMKVLFDQHGADNAVGFNDLTTDAKGRIYVGSIAFAIFNSGYGPDNFSPFKDAFETAAFLFRIVINKTYHLVFDRSVAIERASSTATT